MNPLPPPDELAIRIHHDPDGYRFEIMHGEESIYLHPKPALREATARRQAAVWGGDYADADPQTRCRMCGYDWSAVGQHLEPEEITP